MAGLSNLIPLIILFIVVGVLAFIGYSVYIWSNELADKASKKMEQKNMSFSKDGGLKVKLREVNEEKEADKTQNVLVNVWNNAQFPNYKSSLGWNSGAQKKSSSGSGSDSPRPSVSRSGSSQSRVTGRTATGSTLAPPEHKSSQRRSASPIPGGFD